MTEEKLKAIAGLRELADFLEANEEFPVPDFSAALVCLWTNDAKELMAGYARMMGRAHKVSDETYFSLVRYFGPIALRVTTRRSKVCRKVVKEIRDIPEEIVPERVIPAHQEEVVEWECDPILEPEQVAS